MRKIYICLLLFVLMIYLISCDSTHNHIYNEGQCDCGKLEEYSIIFKDKNFQETIIIEYGKKIDLEKNNFLNILDKLFIGWYLDEQLFDFNSPIYSSLILESKYLSVEENYHVKYVIDNQYKYYQSKEEMVLDFLYDFYDFISPMESLKTFIYGSNNNGTWVNYIGGSEGYYNYLIFNNDIDALNDDYFFNSSKYKDKWYNLSSYMKNEICKNNKRFGYKDIKYNYGALDFKRYILNDPDEYISTYGGNDIFYNFPNRFLDIVKSYTYTSDDISLYIPDTMYFDGWYLDENFNDGPYTKIESGSYGDKTFYAKIKESIKYTISFDYEIENLIVEEGMLVTLPTIQKEGYIFDGWYLDYEKMNDEFIYNYKCSINLKPKFKSIDGINYDYLKYDGNVITYRNEYVAVEIPDTYVEKEVELRACWVSSFINNFSPSTNIEKMKNELISILDFLDLYNMNCIIFHVRTHNNAFYQTLLAPIDSKYGTFDSFSEWDYLEWFIDECHKRNIEFHAWLNPYRISNSGIALDKTEKDVADKYIDYPINPACNPENILLTYLNDSYGAILDPCKQEVKDYIVDVCLELVNKYDVDAIHFDDYFYQKLSQSSNILEEDDQDDYEEYIINSNVSWDKNSILDKEKWRRMNVDNLIEQIHYELEIYNQKKGKNVKFGISPTGVYKSGDGSVESGSCTTASGHYGAHLYCDTVKWIQEGWIDYIMPQCYTSFDNRNFSFHEITTWWNKVVENTNVNLYIGIGLSLALTDTYTYSFMTQEDELINQLLYLNTLSNVEGVSFFSFSSMKRIYQDPTCIAYKAFIKLKEEFWLTKITTPSIN